MAKPQPRAQKKPVTELALESKYVEAGWYIMRTKGSINDYIAHKDQKLHFIQMYNADDSRHEQLAKNTFIQNAFSNNAAPVYAAITPHKRPDGTIEFKIDLTNVNTNTKVILARALSQAKPKEEAK